MKWNTLSDAMDYAYSINAGVDHPIYASMDELESRCSEVDMNEEDKVAYFNYVLKTLTDNA